MGIDAVLSILALLLHWRVVLSLVCASVSAWVLVFMIPLLSGLQALVLVALGLLFGIVWDGHGQTSKPAIQANTRTSTFVATTSAALMGSVWGAISASTTKSIIVGAVVLCIAACIWYWHAMTRSQLLSNPRALLFISTSVVAYAIGAAL